MELLNGSRMKAAFRTATSRDALQFFRGAIDAQKLCALQILRLEGAKKPSGKYPHRQRIESESPFRKPFTSEKPRTAAMRSGLTRQA